MILKVLNLMGSGGTVLSKNTIYKITVLNFEKYNGKIKKGYKSVMISTDFLDDAKVSSLPAGGKLLYLGLILRCGYLTSSSIEGSHDLLVRLAGGSGQVVQRLIDQLESLQLVTFEKKQLLMNLKEVKRKEVKRTESEGLKEAPSRPAEKAADIISPATQTWRAFKEAYAIRYKVDPTWNAKVAGQIKNFVARVPGEEAPKIAAFYLKHNGARYVASGHGIGLLLMDAEKLRTEWLSGNKITSGQVRSADAGDSMMAQVERLQRGDE